MKIGTKSLLWGAHLWWWHPITVFLAWWKLYGFPWDPRLWVAFFVHDIGYWGKPNMDGPEGETHPELGAKIMHKLFDWNLFGVFTDPEDEEKSVYIYYNVWGNFCLFHSRYYAKKENAQYSKLCVADKYSIKYDPKWFYLLRTWLTGEAKEYMAVVSKRQKAGEAVFINDTNTKTWYDDARAYMINWAIEHKDIKPDVWTPYINTTER